MLISPEYAALNAEHHQKDGSYGAFGGNAENLIHACEQLGTRDVLDYGCGKGALAARLPWPIKEYDPAIPGKDSPPEPADIVICRDVLEHIEPEYLDAVLADLARCVKKIGLFSTATGPSWDVLSDGRNAHLIQQPWEWWKERLSPYFTILGAQEVGQITGKGHRMFIGGTAIYFAVTPKHEGGNGNG
jgi:2-polyprenyl-3-methyl-5-hydroxy-6-metoxy-1,4-benzoquinol methylase